MFVSPNKLDMRLNNSADVMNYFRGKRHQRNYYVAGFVDGEGSFSVSIVKHPTQKLGWMINPCFQVYQHEKHREVLELMKETFGTGTIYRKSGTHPVLNFSIDSRRSIMERVIPFFERYPLLVKAETFVIFKEIMNAMEKREHWTKDGFVRIATLAYSMNQQGKRRKYTLKEMLATLPN